jgi:hypothetical protein
VVVGTALPKAEFARSYVVKGEHVTMSPYTVPLPQIICVIGIFSLIKGEMKAQV